MTIEKIGIITIAMTDLLTGRTVTVRPEELDEAETIEIEDTAQALQRSTTVDVIVVAQRIERDGPCQNEIVMGTEEVGSMAAVRVEETDVENEDHHALEADLGTGGATAEVSRPSFSWGLACE